MFEKQITCTDSTKKSRATNQCSDGNTHHFISFKVDTDIILKHILNSQSHLNPITLFTVKFPNLNKKRDKRGNYSHYSALTAVVGSISERQVGWEGLGWQLYSNEAHQRREYP